METEQTEQPTEQTTEEKANYLMSLICYHKDVEKHHEKQRNEAEQELITLLAFAKQEGSETIKTKEFKVTFQSKLNRYIDESKWLQVRDEIPEHLRPISEVINFKIIDKGYRWLENNEPELFNIACQAITVKPAKVAVKIDRLMEK